jgi:DNA-binding transcriptional ArsR family regulator
MIDGDRTLSPDRHGTTGPATDAGVAGSFEPDAVRMIRDVDTLRAISDPTRMRILEAMVQRLEPAWSVRELATALGVPQTRLYHHVELLSEHDLIRATERRVVSGIIETRYQIAAQAFQLDRDLLSGGSEEAREAVHNTLAAVFDTARSEIELAIRLDAIDTSADAPQERRVLLSRGLARLTPARVAELRKRLQALSDEFGGDTDPDGTAFGIVLAVYPLPPTATEPTDV